MKNKSALPLSLLVLVCSNPLASQIPDFKIPNHCKEKYFLTSDSVRLRYLVAGEGEALRFYSRMDYDSRNLGTTD